MESRYSPQDIEQEWYKTWEEAGAFKPQGPGKPFTIVIPPPNVTGALHMGHALNNTLQDVLTRFKRLQGYRTLWQPGTDHAGIATQSVVEKMLAKEGVRRQDLGREKFVEKVWEWKNEYGGRIVSQLKRLGSSCDWSRLRFTMDEGLSRAVREVFVKLYEDGLIYRGNRLINWCPKLQTALADEEVDNKEEKGFFWSIRYALDGRPGESITVSTTRPETMFGDVAIAVNAEDERYKHLIGTFAVIPTTDRKIPIIADEHADPAKGTGAVKITPAHDYNDYEVGQRHKLTPVIAMNLDATLNEMAGKYAGLDRFVARKRLVADLEAAGQLAGVEDRVIPIPRCYRSDDVVEPYLLDQWFVYMKPLAEPALKVVEEGKTRFVPERYTKTYRAWLEPFKDWCISRQLWWGHQIPAWYVVSETGGEKKQATPVIVALDAAEAQAKAEARFGAGATLVQDEDVLDTWFSSGLWPFSTMGWPEKTPEVATHYPGDVLVTDRGIIYFWVARMIFTGLKFTGKTPFHSVYIHGTILDEKGQRMSKSKGNGIDPIEMIEKYGADAVRFALMILTTEGQDIKLSPVKFETGRNFANKLWNAVRFVHPHLDAVPHLEGNLAPVEAAGLLGLHLADRWILGRLDETIRKVTDSLEPKLPDGSAGMRFSEAAQALYQFTWDDFCSTYLEIRKKVITGEAATPEAAAAKRQAVSVFASVLDKLIVILHPFMPFITEEIHKSLGKTGLLMTSAWPAPGPGLDKETAASMGALLRIVESLRAIRGDYALAPTQSLDLEVSLDDAVLLARLKDHQDVITSLDRVGKLTLGTGLRKPPFSASGLFLGGRIYIPLEGILDIATEKARLAKELAKAEGFAAAQEKKLGNEGFVKSAPPEVVEGERVKLKTQRDKIDKLKAALADLG
jgi:valyl-tRNA synthetase